MNTILRNLMLGAGLVGGAMLVTPALADQTTTTVDPETGASVTVHEEDALLPRNRDTTVIVTPGVEPDRDVDIVDEDELIGDDGTVVEHREETTIKRY